MSSNTLWTLACLSGTESFAKVYQDDIIVLSASEDEHLKHLQIIFDKLNEYGLIINPKKCIFGKTTKHFHKRSQIPFHSTSGAKKVFHDPKRVLADAVMLAHPLEYTTVTIYADASDDAAAVCLHQKVGDKLQSVTDTRKRHVKSTEYRDRQKFLEKQHQRVPLFIGLNVVCGCGTFLVLVLRSQHKSPRIEEDRDHLVSSGSNDDRSVDESEVTQDSASLEDKGHDSKLNETLPAFLTFIRLFVQPEMLLLSITYLYTVLELAFFSGVYSTCLVATKQFGSDSDKLVGLTGIMVGVGEISGGAIFGIFGKKTIRYGRDPVVLLDLNRKEIVNIKHRTVTILCELSSLQSSTLFSGEASNASYCHCNNFYNRFHHLFT
ncbi:unnamed protein product [Clavelina lepadiformis]|uniref:UNC93-like protein MFSD11 n=1 Tax=Clavelina lepadiformis TaxID=159417 RepID=A0ABP0GEJ9_CLALP